MRYLRIATVAFGFLALLGCSSKTEIPADSQELRDQQDKTQQQADQDERQYQKEQKKRK